MTALSASEYRKAQSKEITLPSGFAIVCRKPFLDRMLEAYDLRPAQMQLQRAISAARQEADPEARAKLAAASASDAFALNCAMICDAAIDPPLSLQPCDDKLCVQELDEADYTHLTTVLWEWQGIDIKGAAELAPFRQPHTDSGVGGETGDEAEPFAEGPSLAVI